MMTHQEALEVLAARRGDHIVITTMGSVALWPRLPDSPRDFHYLPSSMGQGVPRGLGLCLAKPGLPVVVLVGDGGLLMNLGCLVTAAQFILRGQDACLPSFSTTVLSCISTPARGIPNPSARARAG